MFEVYPVHVCNSYSATGMPDLLEEMGAGFLPLLGCEYVHLWTNLGFVIIIKKKKTVVVVGHSRAQAGADF